MAMIQYRKYLLLCGTPISFSMLFSHFPIYESADILKNRNEKKDVIEDSENFFESLENKPVSSSP